MRQISLLGFSGITGPYTIEVCDVFFTNCYLVGISNVIPPVGPPVGPVIITLPSFLDSVPVIVVKITDADGCVVTHQLDCGDNELTCDITYNLVTCDITYNVI
jgi:hypothetical protein